MGDTPAIPEGYEKDLSGYGPVLYDGHCGEPIAWGFEIRRRLEEERFGALGKYGQLECISGMNPTWVVVVKRLTVDEAIAKYGPMTDLKLGPRGGFRSVTYGAHTFFSRHLCPV